MLVCENTMVEYLVSLRHVIHRGSCRMAADRVGVSERKRLNKENH